MKIYCEKCHEDITFACNKNIENYTVGRTICPKCHYEQKRYISEADLLLYFAVNELIYMILSLFTMFMLRRFGISIPIAIIIFATFIVFYLLAKEISSRIYNEAFYKKEVRNKVFPEDAKAIQRNLSWQFMLFFAIVISFMTIEEGRIFFGIAMPIAILLSFVKFFLQVRNEKNS